MIPLALGVAILDEHTRLTCLQTNALLAAFGAAVGRRIAMPTTLFLASLILG
jgi:hypothetical protein